MPGAGAPPMLKLADEGGLAGSPAATTFRDAALPCGSTQARAGAIRTKSGDVYKPSALRGYEQALRLRLLPPLGAHRLADCDPGADLQQLVSRLAGIWPEPELDPQHGQRRTRDLQKRRPPGRWRDPDEPHPLGFRLPAVRGRRERIASPDEATRLLRVLPPDDRALWATALLRRPSPW